MLSNSVGGLITKGLCLPACKGMITNHFHLSCGFKVTVDMTGGGGGPYPYPAWNQTGDIQNFYTPTKEQPLHVPLDRESNYFKKYRNVTICVSFKEHSIEKIYRVPENKAKWVVSVINLLNTTKDQITLKVSNVKQIATKMVLSIKSVKSWTRK